MRVVAREIRRCGEFQRPSKRREHSAGGSVAASVYIIQPGRRGRGIASLGAKSAIDRPHHSNTDRSPSERRALYTRRFSLVYIGLICVRSNLPNIEVLEKESFPMRLSGQIWGIQTSLRNPLIRSDQLIRFSTGSEIARWRLFSAVGKSPKKAEKRHRAPHDRLLQIQAKPKKGAKRIKVDRSRPPNTLRIREAKSSKYSTSGTPRQRLVRAARIRGKTL